MLSSTLLLRNPLLAGNSQNINAVEHFTFKNHLLAANSQNTLTVEHSTFKKPSACCEFPKYRCSGALYLTKPDCQGAPNFQK